MKRPKGCMNPIPCFIFTIMTVRVSENIAINRSDIEKISVLHCINRSRKRATLSYPKVTRYYTWVWRI